MRLLAIILVLLFALAGAVFGALNADLVAYDLAFGSITVPKGAAVLAALLLGWIVGGAVVWLLAVYPARRGWRKARRDLAAVTPAEDSDPPSA